MDPCSPCLPAKRFSPFNVIAYADNLKSLEYTALFPVELFVGCFVAFIIL